MLICCWNDKIIGDNKIVPGEGPPPHVAMVIRSSNEFMDELYQLTGYQKQYTGLAVTCR